MCGELECLGINGLEISSGLAVSLESAPTPRIIEMEEEATFAENALVIADKVNIPVISVGGHRTTERIESWINK